MLNKDLNGIVYKNEVFSLGDYADHDELYEYEDIDNSNDKYTIFRQNWWGSEFSGQIEVVGKVKRVEKDLPTIISYLVDLGYAVKIDSEREFSNFTNALKEYTLSIK